MISAVTVEASREQVVDFTVPFFFDTVCILYKKDIQGGADLLLLARLFSWEILMYTGVAYIVTSVIYYYIERFSPVSRAESRMPTRQDTSGAALHMWAVLWGRGELNAYCIKPFDYSRLCMSALVDEIFKHCRL